MDGRSVVWIEWCFFLPFLTHKFGSFVLTRSPLPWVSYPCGCQWMGLCPENPELWGVCRKIHAARKLNFGFDFLWAQRCCPWHCQPISHQKWQWCKKMKTQTMSFHPEWDKCRIELEGGVEVILLLRSLGKDSPRCTKTRALMTHLNLRWKVCLDRTLCKHWHWYATSPLKTWWFKLVFCKH